MRLRFKKGDKIKIIDDHPITKNWGHQVYGGDMSIHEERLEGKMAIIKDIYIFDEDYYGYNLDIDNGKYLWSEAFLEPVNKTKKDKEYDKNKYNINNIKIGDRLFFMERKWNFGEQTKVLAKIGNLICLSHAPYGNATFNAWFTLKELKEENPILKYQ